MVADLTEGPVCPVPIGKREQVILGHGSGGKLTRDLIRNVFSRHLANPILAQENDAARLPAVPGSWIPVVSTDAHVVTPIFFPGGDIGRLAICGTVNDVAMLGASPRYLTASFILEEGLQIDDLDRVVRSMAQAGAEAGVLVTAGDTKVVERGKADRIYISTTGFGYIEQTQDVPISGASATPGDLILLSGTIGDHGIAVLSARNDLSFEVSIPSDVAPLNHMIMELLQAAPHTHVLRDPTRGGLATTLVEICLQSQVDLEIQQQPIPIRPAVSAACEALGFDPLYLANEGKLIAIVPPGEAPAALQALRAHQYGAHAAIIGTVSQKKAKEPETILHTPYGTSRLLSMLAGEMLPRIC